MTTYFDTSALVKLLVAEPGGDVVGRCWLEADVPYASVIGYAELRGSVARAIQGHRLDQPASMDARRDLEMLWGQVVTVIADERLARAAGSLAQRHALGALDAIHLASALSLATVTDVPDFVAFDHRLRGAAAAEGLVVLPETV